MSLAAKSAAFYRTPLWAIPQVAADFARLGKRAGNADRLGAIMRNECIGFLTVAGKQELRFSDPYKVEKFHCAPTLP